MGHDAARPLVDEERIIRRRAPGAYQIDIPGPQRELLRKLPLELRSLLESDHPSLRRLFPPAYPDDPERDAEYEAMVRAQLVASRKKSLDILERTIDAEQVDAEELSAWLSVLNDLRLFIGTSLDVTEEFFEEPILSDDPAGHALALYLYLGWLEEQAVEALAADLPDGTD
jgi:hypothetical protein